MDVAAREDFFGFKLAKDGQDSGFWGALAEKAVNRVLGFDELTRIYSKSSASKTPQEFVDRALEAMDLDIHCTKEDMGRVPKKGPAVLVANHPFGGVEGLIMAHLLLKIRPDVKIMANYLLDRVAPMRDIFIFVDPFDRSQSVESNLKPLREAISWVKGGGLLVIFPAGEVAHLRLKTGRVQESPWSRACAQIIAKTKAKVITGHFAGKNNALFQVSGLVHPLLRTALLPRALGGLCGKTVRLRLGGPIPASRLTSFNSLAKKTDYLRGRSFLLARSHKPPRRPVRIRRLKQKPLAQAPDSPLHNKILAGEIEALAPSQLMAESGDFAVYLAPRKQIPQTMLEIGRLREHTFRQAGEGSGQSLDLDKYDSYYQHLILWHQKERELMGSYRMGLCDQIIQDMGFKGVYCHSLFNYGPRFMHSIAPALELGRSFVRPKYQRTFSALLLLWKGIGKFLAEHPQYRYMIGTVSMSHTYQPLSRRLIRDFFQQHLTSPLASLVRPRRPVRIISQAHSESRCLLKDIDTLDQLSDLVSDIEPDGKGLPILFKQYSKLGARSLGWNLDPSFGNVIDCLMLCDLKDADPKTLVRYCGPEGAKVLMEAHQSQGPGGQARCA